ncbi:protein MpMAX2 [Marchantia polymorpha subsp. ruderalis]
MKWPTRIAGGEGTAFPSSTGVSRGMGRVRQTQISDLPGAVLTSIFSLVSDPRTRNNMALACRDWYLLERQTRSSLMLRGNVCNLMSLPHSFRNITQLDLSCCSPWGYSVFQSTSTGGEMVGQLLREAFPKVKDVAIYVRDAVDIQMVAWLWPEVESLRLVRWHQRAMEPGSGMEIGTEVECLLKCQKLRKLDLSQFYCWTEDIPPALETETATAANLLYLDLLKISPEGFKTTEITAITLACKNLEQLFILCQFDPRYLDSVGDQALATLGTNCPRLRVLHLVDSSEWGALRSDLNDDFAEEDANVTRQGLGTMFKSLPHLEGLALILGQNARNSGPALEQLFNHCTKLTSLQLSQFHGLWFGPQEDGIAAGSRLTELTIKNSVDLSDSSLAAIGRGCKRLKKLCLRGCRGITEEGVRECVSSLSKTLIDVEIFCCRLLPALETLRALEPIRNSIQRLHLDCVWDVEVVALQAKLSSTPVQPHMPRKYADEDRLRCEMEKRGFLDFWDVGRKSSKLAASQIGTSSDTSLAVAETTGLGLGLGLGWDASSSSKSMSHSNGHSGCDNAARGQEDEAPDEKVWPRLQFVSLWVGVGVLISPLASMGLGRCPALTEMLIKVEGDCKPLKKPASADHWGLASLGRYPNFKKLTFDLSEVVSFSMSAPEGMVDLQVWERYFLGGMDQLALRDLDYRPPSDKDLNNRGISLPAAGVLSQCPHLRRLIVHGSMHEHFLSMIGGCRSLRDCQLRWDYYPAPEYETSTEVRIESTRRFEAALDERRIPD